MWLPRSRWRRLASCGRHWQLIQLGAYVTGTNPVLDASIQLRPELLEFLRQEHPATSTLPETLARMEALAARLSASAQPVKAK